MRLATALLFFGCLTASANASVIDVNNLIPPTASGAVEPAGFGRGQTFQMGQTGSLDRIAVSILNNNPAQGPVTVKLYELNGTETNGAPLSAAATATVELNSGSDPTVYDFHFANLNYPAGQKLAFALYGRFVGLALADAGPPNAEPIIVDDEKLFFAERHAVFATYVTPVPEPCLAPMVVVSSVMLLMRGKRCV